MYIMKKVLLFIASSFAVLSMSAQGTLTFSQTNNDNDMLFYASPTMAAPQKIVTDAGLVPEVSEMGYNYSIPLYVVECLATKADLSKGNPNVSKDGAATRTVLPANGKVVALGLPGELKGGNSDILEEVTFLKNLGSDVIAPPYQDVRYPDINDVVYDPAQGFVQYNALTTCHLGAAGDGTLFRVPFIQPYIYYGESLLTAIYLRVEGGDRAKNVMFDFGKTAAQSQIATVYHSHAEGENFVTNFNFYAGCNLSVGGPAVQAVLDYLDLDEYSLPAFQLDFYTNDIRGIVNLEGVALGGVTVTLLDEQGAVVATTTTDADGKFIFEALDHTHSYAIEIEGYEIEDNVVDFGNNAIENDINVIVNLLDKTGVDATSRTRQVADVKYVNVNGVISSEAMPGVNMQVTTYSDGSRKVTKMIK